MPVVTWAMPWPQSKAISDGPMLPNGVLLPDCVMLLST
jgi:hypothetical protein